MNIPAARVLEWACLPCAVCVYRQTVEFLRRSVLDDEVSQFRNAKSDLFDCAPLPIRLHLLAYYLHQYKIGGVPDSEPYSLPGMRDDREPRGRHGLAYRREKNSNPSTNQVRQWQDAHENTEWKRNRKPKGNIPITGKMI